MVKYHHYPMANPAQNILVPIPEVPLWTTTTVKVEAANVQYVEIWPTSNSCGFLIDNVQIDDTQSKFLHFTETTPGGGGITASAPVKDTTTINVPLGSVFTLRFEDKKAPTSVFAFSLTDEVAAPAVTESSARVLFPDKTVLKFEKEPSSDSASFMALRMGSAKVVVTPIAGEPVSVAINVMKPATIGAKNNVWNELVVRWAHQRAIPPQWIKAQIENEAEKHSNGVWNEFTFRYEPLSVDLAWTSRPGENPPATREQCPYSRYRLPTQPNDKNLPQGIGVNDEDIEPRQKFYIDRDTVRKIEPNDANVTALEIYTVNDGFNKEYKVKRWNWSIKSPGRAKQVEEDPSILSFNAQTTIAGSYGLMQTLYSSAILPWQWKDWTKVAKCGATVDLRPSLLFDTAENIDAGDGSVAISTRGLVYHFYASAEKNGIKAPLDVESYAEFWGRWRALSLARYNTWKEYPTEVGKTVPTFAPAAASPVFGQ